MNSRSINSEGLSSPEVFNYCAESTVISLFRLVLLTLFRILFWVQLAEPKESAGRGGIHTLAMRQNRIIAVATLDRQLAAI